MLGWPTGGHRSCCLLRVQVALQDSRSRAAIELPGLTTQALLRTYQEHAKDKLPLVQALLTKQGLL